MDVDDEALWTRVVEGHGESFGVIFDRHKARVKRHSLRLAPSTSDADDIVAIVFLEAWRLRERVRFVDRSLLPWLLKVATNTSHNFSRSARRHARALAQLPLDEHTADHADALDDGEAVAALRRMPLRDREVVVLCVLEGLSPSDAAHVLGLRAGTVRSRLSRAKSHLRGVVTPTRTHFNELGDAHA